MMDFEDLFFKGFIGLVILFILTLIIVGVLLIGGLRDIGVYQGEHTGYITAVEHRSNLIWPSDIVYFKTDTESTQEDVYCVVPELLDEVKALQRNRSITTLSFKNDFLMWAWDCNGGTSIIWKVSGI